MLQAQNCIVALVQQASELSEDGFSKCVPLRRMLMCCRPKHHSGNDMHCEMLHMGKKWQSGQGYTVSGLAFSAA